MANRLPTYISQLRLTGASGVFRLIADCLSCQRGWLLILNSVYFNGNNLRRTILPKHHWFDCRYKCHLKSMARFVSTGGSTTSTQCPQVKRSAPDQMSGSDPIRQHFRLGVTKHHRPLFRSPLLQLLPKHPGFIFFCFLWWTSVWATGGSADAQRAFSASLTVRSAVSTCTKAKCSVSEEWC